MKLIIDVACTLCGGIHQLPLDDAGRFEGPAPCDETKHFALSVDPSEWRATVEAEKARLVN